MGQTKWCCRIFPVVVILLSGAIAAGIWYFEERKYSFAFLSDKNEIFNYLGTVLFIAILPIGIFYWLNDKEKYRLRARPLAMLGFIPALAFMIFRLLA
ncbi:hypothetical protein [Maribellus sp. YY47]|uniref:hypothetical protein n=1 Tax=Maribellus sp. YY47 TaxID=2929486 RepID=UPI002001BE94|nr:hypothetical protein [Maribellus sp. YY47]MCK3684603.1 hypothetical protein [Maribellus sp. YY47]